jgi:type VI secretion system protein ImpM
VSAGTAFLFGKLPAHGDFVSRGTPDAMHRRADETIAEALAIAEYRWAEAWDALYAESPVWRFAAAPGVFEDAWVTGVFVPSIDSVGRRFPLVAGVRGLDPAHLAVPGRLEAFVERAENASREALMTATPADALLAQLADAVHDCFSRPGHAEAGSALLVRTAGNPAAYAVWWIEAMAPERRLFAEGPLSSETIGALFLPVEAPAAVSGTDAKESAPAGPAQQGLENPAEGAKIEPESGSGTAEGDG